METKINNVLKSKISNALKIENFSGKGLRWYWQNDQIIHLIELQRSTWSESYYINIGAYSLALGSNKSPKWNECHASARLSAFLQKKEYIDFFTFNNLSLDQKVEKIEQFIEIILKEFIPIIDHINSHLKLRKFINRTKRSRYTFWYPEVRPQPAPSLPDDIDKIF